MRALLATVLATGALMGTPALVAAPAPADKSPCWEYAELHVQPAAGPPRPIAPALAGGGNPMPVAPAPVTVRWATGDEDVRADGWGQLAEKLKAPAPKGEATPTVHKLRVFNRLGADGWELAQHTGTDGMVGTATWIFRRRRP